MRRSSALLFFIAVEDEDSHDTSISESIDEDDESTTTASSIDCNDSG